MTSIVTAHSLGRFRLTDLQTSAVADTSMPFLCRRCGRLSRTQHASLVSALRSYLRESCAGEVCVLAAVDWLRDRVHEYLEQDDDRVKAAVAETPNGETFTRLWIYSHHIYNKSKRKNILEWAKELQLSGFCMPGKPGVVCVEGLQSACEEFWSRCVCCSTPLLS